VFIIEIDLASLRFFLSYSKYLTAARRHGTFNHNKNYLATVSEKKLSKKKKTNKKNWLADADAADASWLAGSRFSAPRAGVQNIFRVPTTQRTCRSRRMCTTCLLQKGLASREGQRNPRRWMICVSCRHASICLRLVFLGKFHVEVAHLWFTYVLAATYLSACLTLFSWQTACQSSAAGHNKTFTYNVVGK
jgi:hypothetical protein